MLLRVFKDFKGISAVRVDRTIINSENKRATHQHPGPQKLAGKRFYTTVGLELGFISAVDERITRCFRQKSLILCRRCSKMVHYHMGMLFVIHSWKFVHTLP